MKRITFALCIILISLSTMAQGTLQERLKGNPKIDSLVSKVAALGGSGQVSYYYDGKLHKTVSIFCSLMNDFEPTPPTGDSQRDARNQKMDSVRKERCEQGNRIYNIVRNTCKAQLHMGIPSQWSGQCTLYHCLRRIPERRHHADLAAPKGSAVLRCTRDHHLPLRPFSQQRRKSVDVEGLRKFPL